MCSLFISVVLFETIVLILYTEIAISIKLEVPIYFVIQ